MSRWYTKQELYDVLRAKNYCHEIAEELSGWFAEQLELARKSATNATAEDAANSEVCMCGQLITDHTQQTPHCGCPTLRDVGNQV